MLPKVKAAIDARAKKQATDLPNAREAETKTRTAMLARRAVAGDIDQLDLDNLDALGRITGDLANTYIESVSAAKITSATMLATTLTLAGTDASNNKTSLVMIGDALMRVNDGISDRIKVSNSGMEIDAANNEAAAASGVVGRGIFNTGAHWTGIWPFTNANRRGWQMRSDGVAGGSPQGNMRLVATRGSGNVATDTGSWASAEMNVEGSGVGAISGYAGVIIRNMLWVVGPARVAGALDITGAVIASGNVNISGNIPDVGNINMRSAGRYQHDGTAANFGGGITTVGAIVSGAGITSNTGNFASPTGVTLDLLGGGDDIFLRGNRVNCIPRLRAEGGLTVLGALSLPTDSVDNVMLRSHPTDNALRSVGTNHIFDGHVDLSKIAASAKNADQGVSSLRSIGALLGGTALNAASGNHSHSSGNAMNIDRIPEEDQRRILAYRNQVIDDVQKVEGMSLLQLKAFVYNLAAVASAALAFAIDAPDMDADERRARKDAGEKILPGWEYRASIQREKDGTIDEPPDSPDGTLFRGQKHYGGGAPPRSIRPPGLRDAPLLPLRARPFEEAE